MPDPIRIQLLGQPRLTHSDRQIGGAAARPKALLFLACVADSAGGGVVRSRLKELFWPDSHAEAARTSLKQTLYLLRKETGLADLFLSNGTVSLNPDVVEVDLWQIRQAIADGDAAAALALYQGGLLVGLKSDLPTLNEWLISQRSLLHDQLQTAIGVALAPANIRTLGAAAVDLWIQGARAGFDVSGAAASLADWITSDAGAECRPRLPELLHIAAIVERHIHDAGVVAVFTGAAVACGTVQQDQAGVVEEPAASIAGRRSSRRRWIHRGVVVTAITVIAAAFLVSRNQRHAAQIQRVVVDRFDCAGPGGRGVGDPWLSAMTAEALRTAPGLGIEVQAGGTPDDSALRVTATCMSVSGRTELRYVLERGAKHEVVRTLLPVALTDEAAATTRAVDRLVGAVGIEVDPQLAIWKGSQAGDADLETWRLVTPIFQGDQAAMRVAEPAVLRRALARDSTNPIVRLLTTSDVGSFSAGWRMGAYAPAGPFSRAELDEVRARLADADRQQTRIFISGRRLAGSLLARFDSLSPFRQSIGIQRMRDRESQIAGWSVHHEIDSLLRNGFWVSELFTPIHYPRDDQLAAVGSLQAKYDSLPPLEREWMHVLTGLPLTDSTSGLLDRARRLLAAAPSLPAPRRWMPEVYLLTGFPDSALQALRSNRETLPATRPSRSELAVEFESLMAVGKFPEALKVLQSTARQTIADNPGFRSDGGGLVSAGLVSQAARVLVALGRQPEARELILADLGGSADDSIRGAFRVVSSHVAGLEVPLADSIVVRELRRNRQTSLRPHPIVDTHLGDEDYWRAFPRDWSSWNDPRFEDNSTERGLYMIHLLEAGSFREACAELGGVDSAFMARIEFMAVAVDAMGACNHPRFRRTLEVLLRTPWPNRPGLTNYYAALALSASNSCMEARSELASAFDQGMPFQAGRFLLREWAPCLGNKFFQRIIPSREFSSIPVIGTTKH